MEAVTIFLAQVNRVQHFVKLVSKVPLRCRYGVWTAHHNAKSLLGIYSVDLKSTLAGGDVQRRL
jgi:hypothetical protein